MLGRIIGLLVMLGLSSCGVSVPPMELRPCAQFFYGDVPLSQDQNTTFLCRAGYATLHNNLLKVPVYSAHKLEGKNLNGTITRTDDFRPDPGLAVGTRAELEDYKRSGYDRGHMSPAADFSTDSLQMGAMVK
jgi:endonuclease G, mitochondrial